MADIYVVGSGQIAHVLIASEASATAAAASAVAAAASTVRAEEWAQNPEDDPVETGPDQFSALHWAAKAEAFLAGELGPLGAMDQTITGVWTFGDTSFRTNVLTERTLDAGITVPSEIRAGVKLTALHAFTGAPALPNSMDLFLLAGQSNIIGRGDATLSPDVIATTAFEYTDIDTLVALVDPVDGATDGSAWPAFARRYYAATGRVSAYLQRGESGSAQSVLADSGSGNWDAAGALYAQAVTAANTALTTMAGLGKTVTFRGVLWCQGERDAQEIDTAGMVKADYKAALVAMIARFRVTYGATMPFYIFRTGRKLLADTAGYVDVRAAQDEVAAADAFTWVVFEDAVDFADLGFMSDQDHYTQAGYNLMGITGARNVTVAQGDDIPEPRILLRVDADTRALRWSEDDERFSFAAPLEIVGALTVSGAINGQTISDEAALTGTLSVAGALTVLGNVALGSAAFTPEARLHVKAGSAGTIAAPANAIAVFEHSATTAFIHLQTPNNATSVGLQWGDPEQADQARVHYDHTTDTIALRVLSATTLAVTVTTATVTGVLTVSGGSPGAISDLSGQRAILQANGNVWLHMRTPNNAISGMVFADPESNDRARVQFTHSTDTLTLRVISASVIECVSTGATVNGVLTASAASPGAITNLSGTTLIVQGSGNTWLHFRTPNTVAGVGIVWADPELNDQARVFFNHTTNVLALRVASVNALTVTTTTVTCDVAFAHTGSTAGFYSTAPVTKQAISGSSGGNAAVQSIAAFLATVGLVTNNVT